MFGLLPGTWQFTLAKWGMIALGLLIIFGIAYWYFTYSQNKIQELTAANAQLSLANDIDERTIKILKDEAARQQVIRQQTQTELTRARDRAHDLEHAITTILNDLKANNTTTQAAEDAINQEVKKFFDEIRVITDPNTILNAPTTPTTPSDTSKSALEKLKEKLGVKPSTPTPAPTTKGPTK